MGNRIDIQCKGDKFPLGAGRGGGNSDELICLNPTTWSTPGACVELGCVNPRANYNPWFTGSASFLHTCAELDRINLPLSNVEANDASVIYADHKENNGISSGYSVPRFHQSPYTTGHTNNGLVANVKNGVTYRFTCKKGFRPYYRSEVAVVNRNWDAQ